MYVSSINNLLSFLVFNKQFDEALEYVQKAKKTFELFSLTSENRTLLKQVLRTYNIELEIYRDQKLYEEKVAFIASTEKFVADNEYKMPKEYLLSFWFQLANIHFMRKDYSASLHWINKLLNSKYRAVRVDLRLQVMLLNLMVHFEQRNLMVLRYYVDSTRRYMKKAVGTQAFELVVARFFVKLCRLPTLEYPQAFKTFHQALYPEGGASIIPADFQGYIDYDAWIRDYIKEGI